MKKNRYSLSTCAALMIAAPGVMLPQVGVTAALEEVVVTARKREENLQSTPISVTALSGEAMANAGINELTAIDQQTPNLSFTVGTGGGGSSVNAYVRGVGETDFIITTDPAVGLYLDGVYLARAFGANMELKDIGQIEVLRGPQGSLFGKNSIGGAINVTTRKPDGSTSAEIGLSAGSYDLQELSLYGQTALTDTLAASVSYLQKTADGWQKRPGPDAGDIDLATARVILNWVPNDDFESTLSLDWNQQEQTGYPNVMLSFQDGSFFGDLWNTLNPGSPCCTPNADIDRSGAGGPLPEDDVDGRGINWTNTWVAGDIQLKSITGYREMKAVFGRDGDNSLSNYSGDTHDQEHSQFSQELQLTGNHESFNWIAGAYYFEEESKDDTDLIIIQGIGTSINYDNTQDAKSYALYGHATYHLTESLDVFAGIRYTQEQKDFYQQISSYDFGTPHVFPAPGAPADSCKFDPATATFDCSQDWSNTSPKIGVMYQYSDDVMTYAHVSRGFRSGGFNGRAFGSPSDMQEYEPEIMTSYETGFKAELFDKSLRLNMSLFYNDYKDIQVLITRAASVATENASQASIKGLELEATWLPTSQWQIDIGAGILSDDSDGWVDATGDYTDTELKHTPDYNFNLASEYEFDLGGNGTLVLRGDMKYQSEYYLNSVNTESLQVNGHTLFNAGLIYRPQSDNWSIALQGRNLSDKRVLNSGFDGSAFFGFIEGNYNAPRTYVVNFNYKL